jgi:hypothetical protein
MGLTVNDVTGIGAVVTLATDLVDRLFLIRLHKQPKGKPIWKKLRS